LPKSRLMEKKLWKLKTKNLNSMIIERWACNDFHASKIVYLSARSQAAEKQCNHFVTIVIKTLAYSHTNSSLGTA